MRLKDKQTGEIDEYLFSNKRGDADSVGLNKGDDIDNPIFFNSLAELCERFEDVPEGKKYGGRVPKAGDEYWVVYADGVILNRHWEDTEIEGDSFECGSAFWTYEEAEKELARRKAYVILKEDTKGFKPNWENENEKKHYVVCDYSSDKLVSEWRELYNGGEKLYFATEEDAEASIKAHPSEWRAWLGVEV